MQMLIFLLGFPFGIWEHIWIVDITKISFIIMVVWVSATVGCGCYHFRGDLDKFLPIGWFLAEVCLALGMIGTVTGFLIMLVSAFEGIDVSNISTVQNSLAQMASGMGTALYTTLVGLVSSLFIKFQLVNLENSRVTHGKS
jgi:hypothetical protein